MRLEEVDGLRRLERNLLDHTVLIRLWERLGAVELADVYETHDVGDG